MSPTLVEGARATNFVSSSIVCSGRPDRSARVQACAEQPVADPVLVEITLAGYQSQNF